MKAFIILALVAACSAQQVLFGNPGLNGLVQGGVVPINLGNLGNLQGLQSLQGINGLVGGQQGGQILLLVPGQAQGAQVAQLAAPAPAPVAVRPPVFAPAPAPQQIFVRPAPVSVQVPTRVVVDEPTAPAKYDYSYSVNAAETGDVKSAQESRDGDATSGSYSVVEPDGTLRTVEYSVVGNSGFQAVVKRTPGFAAPAPVVQAARPQVVVVPSAPRPVANIAPLPIRFATAAPPAPVVQNAPFQFQLVPVAAGPAPVAQAQLPIRFAATNIARPAAIPSGTTFTFNSPQHSFSF